MKRVFVLTMLCAAALWAKAPNIVYIMADDHAAEAISAYDSHLKDFAKTPNIDRIAAEGVRFDNFFCNNSICSPSRASILTGQYSHKNGVTNLNGTINDDSPWVSEELQRAGYQTAVFGKWHLKSMPKGFDNYKVTRGQGAWFDPHFYTPAGEERMKGYSSDVYTDVALDWLGRRNPDRPFSLMLHFKAPHHPYDYPERVGGLLAGVKIPEPASLYEDVEVTSPLLKYRRPARLHLPADSSYWRRHKDDEEPPMAPATTHREKVAAAYQHMMHKYIRCVTAVDQNVGRVLDYLDENGLAEDTVVIYTSDQGYWLGQHGLYDKRLILEESMRMPLLVRYPKEIAPGSRCELLGSNVDFAPTMLDYAGAETPAAMQGRSLRPLLQGKKPGDWRQAVFYAYWSAPPDHWGLRTERYTLVHFPKTREIEFYDLKEDPAQNVNQAKNPAYRSAIQRTEGMLEALMKKVDIKPEELPPGE
jgi:arylsulfatase A-like enzyme